MIWSILRFTSQEILSFFAASPLLLNKQSDAEKMETDAEEAMDADERVVPQILVLYYLLLYEDVRMSQIKAITVSKTVTDRILPVLWEERNLAAV